MDINNKTAYWIFQILFAAQNGMLIKNYMYRFGEKRHTHMLFVYKVDLYSSFIGNMVVNMKVIRLSSKGVAFAKPRLSKPKLN